MSRTKELAKNTAILTIGKICTQCISFLLLPLYTAVLSTSDYGTFDLLITYATLMLPLVNWQLDQGLFRFMLDCRGNIDEQRKLFSTLLFFSTLQTIVYIIIYSFISSFIKINNSVFLVIYVILHVYSALMLQFVRGLGKNIVYTIASFISATATTVLNVIALVILRLGLRGLFISTIFAQIITILYLIIATRCWRYFSKNCISSKAFKDVRSYSIPLIPNNLAWWGVNVSDRTIVSHFLGVSINGIYSVANKFPNVFIQFYNILNLSWTETVSLHYNDEDRDKFLSDTLTYLFKIFSSACYMIIAAMPFIYPLMVNEKYSAGYNQVLILMYAMLFRVLVGLYSCIYVAQKNAKKIAYTSISAAIINISTHLLLINKLNLFAASLSTLISFVTMFIVRIIDINRELNVKIRYDVVLKSMFMGIVLIFVYYSGYRSIQVVALMITTIYSVMMNTDIIKSSLGLLKNRITNIMQKN